MNSGIPTTKPARQARNHFSPNRQPTDEPSTCRATAVDEAIENSLLTKRMRGPNSALIARSAYRGDNAELLQQAQLIVFEPLLDDLAACHTIDRDAGHDRSPAGRGNAWNTPVWVPRAVKRATTRSLSASRSASINC